MGNPFFQESSSASHWTVLLTSFVAGAASASALWLYHYSYNHDSKEVFDEKRCEEDNEHDDAADEHVQDDSTSPSRIGELPSKRRHWPWDRKSRSRQNSMDEGDNGESHRQQHDPQQQKQQQSTNSNQSPPNHDDSNAKAKKLCIGSIFGLDVGGTLAKLVYFEQKADKLLSYYDDDHHHVMHSRQRMYRNVASAHAVLLATRRRRERDDERIGTTKQSSYRSTQSTNASEGPATNSYYTPPRDRKLQQQGMRSKSLRECDLRRMHRSAENHRRDHRSDDDDFVTDLAKFHQDSVPDDLHAYAESIHFQVSNAALFGRNKNDVDHHDATVTTAEEPATRRDHDSSPVGSSFIRKTRSMLDFNQALDRFYNFARRLDAQGGGRIRDDKLSFYSRELGGEFHFIQYETRRMQNAMDLIRTNNLHLNIREMGATGGGAHKYAAEWESELGIQMKKQDELDSLVAGMQFVLTTVVGECYTFRPCNREGHQQRSSTQHRHSTSSSTSSSTTTTASTDPESPTAPSAASRSSSNEELEEDRGHGDEWWWSRKVQRDAISYSNTYPYLLVTIGTGVSILRVDGPRKYERISGSTIGGGTYWGLIRLLTDREDFEDVMRLAERGDPSKVDMLVGDIYGKNTDALKKLGLPANLVASSFGKLVAKEDPAAGLKEEDLARALLLMITINIGQVAYLNAQLAKTRRIYFVGNFLRHNKISQRRLAFAINYWSKGEMEALFLEHEGYFGALGAFLLSQDIAHDPTGPKRWQQQRSNTDIDLKHSTSSGSSIQNDYQQERENTGSLHRRSYTTDGSIDLQDSQPVAL